MTTLPRRIARTRSSRRALVALALIASVARAGSATALAGAPPETAPGLEHAAHLTPEEAHAHSPRLRDTPEIPPELGPIREVPRHPRPRRPGPKSVVDPVLQGTTPGAALATAASSFEGTGNISAVLPPDPNGAVGPAHYVQWVNLAFAIFDKTTGARVYGPAAGKTLWQALGGPCAVENDGDPIVLYDHLAGRWVFSQFALPNYPSGPFYQCVAVSETSDPLGAYHLYSFKISDTKLNDYPKLAVWPDGYYMTVNQFLCSGGCSWAGQGVVAFERAKMLDGLPANMLYLDLASVDSTLGGMLPSGLDGPAPPPGTPCYFAQFDDDVWGYSPDQLQIWAFHVDWNTPASSSFTRQASLATAAFDSSLCGYADCVRQAGTTTRLDPLSDRLMYRLQYRNFGGYATLVTNHTVDVDGTDHAGIRWYELRDSGAGWGIYQQGTFAPDADHRWMGSIAMDGQGDIALGYSVSGATTFPSIRYSGRLAGDPLGTLTQAETSIADGTGSQTSSSGRWGDYSAMALDPVDQCTFWYTQEYYAVTSAAGWQTRIAAFRFPTCGTAAGQSDLSLGQTATPGTVSAGADVAFAFAIVNNGPDAASEISLADLLPAGTTLKSASASQGSCAAANPVECALGALDPGASATVTIVVTATTAGSITNTGTVSASQSDPNPADNRASTTVTVLAPKPDLVVTALGNPPIAATPGQALGVTDTVKNQGLASAGASTVLYYLSTDQAKSVDDTRLGGSRSVAILAPGATSTGSASVTVPTTTALGVHYLLACADGGGVVDETDESNNCRASATTVQVTRPDLREAAAGNPPAAVAPGKSIAVSDTVENQGLVSAAASKVRYYLAARPVHSASDTRLTGSRSVPLLAAGATSAGSATVTVPATVRLGAYFLVACADDTSVVIETDETDNCLASASTVQVTRPDLVDTGVSSPPAALARGLSFAVTDTVKNQGLVTAGASKVRYYLSLDRVRSTGDRLLTGSRSVPSLAAGATSKGTATVTIPATTPFATYLVLACADDGKAVIETDETNNCVASAAAISVTP